ncbi:MAG: hypothetical protein DIU71_02030 [Proteobacteria bacterium]|nr:MAG: hypothetical protein DIU71_02030 [Pseudomonadota bacterium]
MGVRRRVSRFGLLATAVGLLTVHAALYAQREFRVYQSFEFEADLTELPHDYDLPAEFVVGRLMYPSGWGFGSFRAADWRQGGTSWAVDYPRGDRTLARMLRRLTRIDVRSVEQPVNPDDGDDIFHWPFLMAGLAGYWDLTDEQVTKLREYLLRGGFLFCDSFFGSDSWVGFEAGMRRIFPDRPIIDLSDDHPIFNIVYDLSQVTKAQIPNIYALYGRGVGYLSDGATPHWRGIEDDAGRLMVLIAFNNDVADSWQWQDDPRYPLESANLGVQLGVNIAVYAMTH